MTSNYLCKAFSRQPLFFTKIPYLVLEKLVIILSNQGKATLAAACIRRLGSDYYATEPSWLEQALLGHGYSQDSMYRYFKVFQGSTGFLQGKKDIPQKSVRISWLSSLGRN